jgi:hypothetical protein
LSPLLTIYTGASNGVTSHSPAQHPGSAYIESPSAFQRPSTAPRYAVPREHSVSVSPKTQPPPRPPSLGSRHSSLHEIQVAGSPVTQIAAQSHVAQPQYQYQQSGVVAPAQPLPNLNTASDVPPYSTPSLQQQTPSQIQPPQPQHYPPSAPPPPEPFRKMSQEKKAPLKRAASDAASQEPPPKRKMMRKYSTRPPWAVLSVHNPRFKQQGALDQPSRPVNGAAKQQPNGQMQQTHQAPPANVDVQKVSD